MGIKTTVRRLSSRFYIKAEVNMYLTYKKLVRFRFPFVKKPENMRGTGKKCSAYLMTVAFRQTLFYIHFDSS